MNGSKRFIEVSLPLAAISEQPAREMSIRHGYISTLHIWWARRPLAAMRAAIFTSLIPASEETAREIMTADLAGSAGVMIAKHYPYSIALMT